MRLNRPPSVGPRRNQEVVSQVRASRSGCYLLFTLGQLLGHHPSLPRLQGIHWLRVLVFRRHLLNANRPCRRRAGFFHCCLLCFIYIFWTLAGLTRGWHLLVSFFVLLLRFFVGKGGALTFRALCLLPPLF